jgi:hypothetical protein
VLLPKFPALESLGLDPDAIMASRRNYLFYVPHPAEIDGVGIVFPEHTRQKVTYTDPSDRYIVAA